MRAYRTWKYVCDYCDKRGGSKWHMERHEKRCTMNPKRECGMCTIIDNDGAYNTKKLVAIVVNHAIAHPNGPWTMEHDKRKMKELVEKLRMESEDCPACILAAFRQANLQMDEKEWLPWHDCGFDFKTEAAAVMTEFYQNQRDDEDWH